MKHSYFCFIVFLLSYFLGFSQTNYISPEGDDQLGNGSINSPYKTIQKAATSATQVLLVEGIYQQEQLLTGISNVTIKPAPGANVVFNGTELIESNWTQHSGNVYKTTLTNDIWQLFINDEEKIMARWPNTTFNNDVIYDNDTWGHSTGQDADGVVNDITNIAALSNETKELSSFSNEEVSGAIIIANFNSFRTKVRKVKTTGLDIANKKFEYDVIGGGYKTKHHYYFLEKKLAFLDSADEWFYDKTTKTLYAWSSNGSGSDLNSAEIRGKVQTFAVNFTNCTNVILEGFKFFGTTVTIQNSSAVQVKNNVFSYPNYSRRMLDAQVSPYNTSPMVTNIDQSLTTGKLPSNGISSNCTFSGNVFEYTDGEALILAGNNHFVSNNYFHHIDWSCAETQSLGLSIFASGTDLTFDHNIMHTLGASATLNLGERAKVLYNDISNTGLGQSDGSIVQITKAIVEGTETAYNWLHDTEKYGFRFDAVAGDAENAGKEGLAHHNVIWNLGKDGYGGIGMMVKGDQQEIYNNTVFNCDKTDILIIYEGGITNNDTYTKNNAADVISNHRVNDVGSSNDIPGFATFNYSLYNDHSNNDTSTIEPLLVKSVAGIYNKNNVVANRSAYNFMPNSSLLENSGTIINTINNPIASHPNVLRRNITANFQGSNPDIGAYEVGTTHWVPGIDFTPTVYPWSWPGSEVLDTVAPIITLTGAPTLDVFKGDVYTDQEATANDDIDGDLTANIVVTGAVDINQEGIYEIKYNVTDAAGNIATEVVRTVTVLSTDPVILSEGYFEVDEDGWQDGGGDCVRYLGSSAYEGNYSMELRDNSGIESSMTSPAFDLLGYRQVEINFYFYANSMETAESLILSYNDGSGFQTVVSYVKGTDFENNKFYNAVVTLDASEHNFVDGGQFRFQANASGNGDMVYVDQVIITGLYNEVSTSIFQTTEVFKDDTTIPVITLTGQSAVEILNGTVYTDAGATATDNVDGDVTANIVVAGSVNVNQDGVYQITYNVVDAAGNIAIEVVRTISVTTPDTTIPVITLAGQSAVEILNGTVYTDAGATATDNVDGDVTANIVVAGSVNINQDGVYQITYNVVDAAGNIATEVVRTITVTTPDTTIPVITLTGQSAVEILNGTVYTDAGAIATDNVDGDVTANIVVAGSVNVNQDGVYQITYNVVDAAGNIATEVVRTITVTTPDTTIPVITLTGQSAVEILNGTVYTDAGATATDNVDGDVTANIVVAGSVNINQDGVYQITYNVVDAAGNIAIEVVRTISVTTPDTTIPVITLTGQSAVEILNGIVYTDAGATATDNVDGDVTANIVVAGSVNINQDGVYQITYNVVDAAGNIATEVVRTITVLSLDPVVLHEGYFETSFDGWQDGGNDCARYSGNRSFEGSYSIKLRDNSGIISSMTSQNFDLSAYNQIEVNFFFYANSMETGEDFLLLYNDGSGFRTVASYVSGTDFNNNTFNNVSLILDASQYNLVANGQFRFQADASGNGDMVYIDQVVITGLYNADSSSNSITVVSGVFKESVLSVVEEDSLFDDDFMLYPNPASTQVTVSIGLVVESAPVDVLLNIYDINGRVIKTKSWSKVSDSEFKKSIDISTLSAGVYMIGLISSDGMRETKRLVIR